jgi:nicotinate-nucleotide pyrophosphorylase (carboxylating)
MDYSDVSRRLEAVLREDVGSGDVTTSLTPNRRIRAVITSSAGGYVSGVQELMILFKSHHIVAKAHVRDGGRLRAGQKVFTLEGMSRDLLPVERTALNILSRMSGITTTTRLYVEALRKMRSKAKIVATRKTTPGLMRLEKKAVRLGGGLTHRMGLYDMILIKDNHLMLFAGDVAAAMKARGGRRAL